MFCSPAVAPLNCSAEVLAMRHAGMLPEDYRPMQGGSFDDLRSALAAWRPHIFWFTGHGDATTPDGERTLGFSGVGRTLELLQPVTVANELRAHLTISGGCLECAVLNACSTAAMLTT